MKITDYIKDLELLESEYGDIEVCAFNDIKKQFEPSFPRFCSYESSYKDEEGNTQRGSFIEVSI